MDTRVYNRRVFTNLIHMCLSAWESEKVVCIKSWFTNSCSRQQPIPQDSICQNNNGIAGCRVLSMSGPCVEPPKQWTTFLKSTMVHSIPHSRTYVPGNHPTPSNTKASRLEDRILTQFTDAIKWHEVLTFIIYCSYYDTF